ncbi:general substrate transporter [Aspergillus similis]
MRLTKPYFGFTGGWLTFWVSLACATDMTLFGYDQGVFSGVVVTPDFLQVHGLVGPSKTKILSTVTAIYDVGCFFGAMLAFTAGERLGRKKTILLGCTIMTIGTLLKASSYSLAQMFVGRIVLGQINRYGSIGNGLSTATAPVWQTETAQARWRGKLVVLELGLNVGGYCLVNWINYGLSFKEGSIAWRLPIALQLFFVMILFATIPWLPESPRWLLSHGRDDEALEVLACIDAMVPDDPYIRTQYDEIKYSIAYERQNAMPWRDLLRNKSDSTKTLPPRLVHFRSFPKSVSTNTPLLLPGINIMSYYLPTVLITSVGLTNSTARLLTACNATSYFIFSCVAVTMIERFGRRGLMLLSGSGQFVSFLVISILLRFAETDTDSDKVYGAASVAFFFLYHVAFGIGMLGVPWLYPTEINSLPMRTKGAAVATATNWITNFAIVEITPIGIQNIGWPFLPVIYFLYPETANRTLEDIDSYYRSNPPLLVTRDPDAISAKRPLKYVQREDEEIQRRMKEARIMGRKSDEASVEHVN